MSSTTCFPIALIVLIAGCEREQAPPPAPAKELLIGIAELTTLGVKLDVAGLASIDERSTRDTAKVMAMSFGALKVYRLDTAQTLEAAQAFAREFSASNLRPEVLPDGWALSWTVTERKETSTSVAVGRTIDGTFYRCDARVATADEAAAALAACKSLRK